MKRLKKLLQNKLVFGLLLAASLGIMGLSGVQTSRAALTFVSEYYSARMEVSNIGIALLENGQAVGGEGTLLSGMLGEGEKLQLGRSYHETLAVRNDGNIEEYVRVILYRYWLDGQGQKNQDLDPGLIDLKLSEDSGWILDESATTRERLVLYYTKPLPVGAVTGGLCDSIRIDDALATRRVTEDGAAVFQYNGYKFMLEAEADGVQAHNAKDAIKSAWGVDVSIGADGSLSIGG